MQLRKRMRDLAPDGSSSGMVPDAEDQASGDGSSRADRRIETLLERNARLEAELEKMRQAHAETNGSVRTLHELMSARTAQKPEGPPEDADELEMIQWELRKERREREALARKFDEDKATRDHAAALKRALSGLDFGDFADVAQESVDRALRVGGQAEARQQAERLAKRFASEKNNDKKRQDAAETGQKKKDLAAETARPAATPGTPAPPKGDEPGTYAERKKLARSSMLSALARQDAGAAG